MKRQPQLAPPERISPLSTLPVFMRLSGRKVVLAGSSEGALWKAELLAAAGAALSVYAEQNVAAFNALSERLGQRQDEGYGPIIVLRRKWTADDLATCAIAIGDFETESEARIFVMAAKAAGAAVNIIDKPEFCDFQFGSIVNRSPLVVSISTDGAAPVFGQAVRARIEAVLPTGLQQWAMAARTWRPAVAARELAYAARRRFWETFTGLAMREPQRMPTDDDRAACFATLEDGGSAAPGSIVLVGAGPGDAALLTLKAVQALQSADVILYDDLVTAQVLDLARREATRIAVGKKGHGRSCAQSDINGLLVQLAQEGKRVVRLKGGDPMVFGRATEELDAARAAGIRIDVVPGVTTAQAAAAALQVSLTERKVARRVQFITGHDIDGALPTDMDWGAIADPGATTAIYMPKKSLPKLVATLKGRGMDMQTPAVVVASVSRETERRMFTTLGSLSEAAAQFGNEPALVLLGQALRNAGET